jgi:hypothetical protein
MKLFKKKAPTIKVTQADLESICRDVLYNVIENCEDDYNQAILYRIWTKENIKTEEEFFALIEKCKASYEKIKSETLFGDVLL